MLTEEEREYLLAALGPDRPDLLSRFERFKNPRTIPVSWNWNAFLFSLGWLVDRRMYLFALPYCAIVAIVFYSHWPLYENCSLRDTAFNIQLLYVLATFIVLPMFADWLYLGHLERQIEKVKAVTPDKQARLHMIAKMRSGSDGSDSSRREADIIARIKAIFLKSPAIVAGIAPLLMFFHSMPNYADYTDRAKSSKAVLMASALKSPVVDFYSEHKRLPKSLEEIGVRFDISRSRYIKNMALDGRTGAIKATITGICSLEGRTLYLLPLAADDRITWKCGIDDASGKLFKHVSAAECRNYINLVP